MSVVEEHLVPREDVKDQDLYQRVQALEQVDLDTGYRKLSSDTTDPNEPCAPLLSKDISERVFEREEVEKETNVGATLEDKLDESDEENRLSTEENQDKLYYLQGAQFEFTGREVLFEQTAEGYTEYRGRVYSEEKVVQRSTSPDFGQHSDEKQRVENSVTSEEEVITFVEDNRPDQVVFEEVKDTPSDDLKLEEPVASEEHGQIMSVEPEEVVDSSLEEMGKSGLVVQVHQLPVLDGEEEPSQDMPEESPAVSDKSEEATVICVTEQGFPKFKELPDKEAAIVSKDQEEQLQVSEKTVAYEKPAVEQQENPTNLSQEPKELAVSFKEAVVTSREEEEKGADLAQELHESPGSDEEPVVISEEDEFLTVSGKEPEELPLTHQQAVFVPVEEEEKLSASAQDFDERIVCDEETDVLSPEDEEVSVSGEETVVIYEEDENLLVSGKEPEELPDQEAVVVPVEEEEELLASAQDSAEAIVCDEADVRSAEDEDLTVSPDEESVISVKDDEKLSVSAKKPVKLPFSVDEAVVISTEEAEKNFALAQEPYEKLSAEFEETTVSDDESAVISSQAAEEKLSVSAQEPEELHVPFSGRETVLIPAEEEKPPVLAQEPVESLVSDDKAVDSAEDEKLSLSAEEPKEPVIPVEEEEELSASAQDLEEITVHEEAVANEGKFSAQELKESTMSGNQTDVVPAEEDERLSVSSQEAKEPLVHDEASTVIPLQEGEQLSDLSTESEKVTVADKEAANSLAKEEEKSVSDQIQLPAPSADEQFEHFLGHDNSVSTVMAEEGPVSNQSEQLPSKKADEQAEYMVPADKQFSSELDTIMPAGKDFQGEELLVPKVDDRRPVAAVDSVSKVFSQYNAEAYENLIENLTDVMKDVEKTEIGILSA